MSELVLATNPDPGSSLPYLLRVPLGPGLVFRVKETWPRTNAVYCHPVEASEWPDEPAVVERVPLRSLARRGAAIDIVAARGRENRSQLVFTRARGREMVFWQSPRTRRQARPDVTLPTARASGVAGLEILVDTHEQRPYRFATQQVTTTGVGLPCGDYAVAHDSVLVASVERKSLPDLVSSLTSGRLRFALGELSALPRAAVIVEERYSAIFGLERVRPALVADGLAELQVRWPAVPMVFCDNRRLAEEWVYRYLAAAHTWAVSEEAAVERIGLTPVPAPALDAPRPGPSRAEIAGWARAAGLDVANRGRLPAAVVAAYEAAHPDVEAGSGDAPSPHREPLSPPRSPADDAASGDPLPT
jgi:hypothetical protein